MLWQWPSGASDEGKEGIEGVLAPLQLASQLNGSERAPANVAAEKAPLTHLRVSGGVRWVLGAGSPLPASSASPMCFLSA